MKSQFTKYRVPAACLFTLLLPGIVPSIATAAAPTVTRYQFRGLTAHVDSYSVSGTVETDVQLDATEGLGKDPTTLFVSVTEYDVTTFNPIGGYSGEVPLTGSQFQISNTLQSASLNVAGIVLQDFTGNSVNADISVTWTGSGPSSTGRNTSSWRSGPFSYHEHSAGTFRDATAAGSLVINGTDFLAGGGDYEYTYADLQKTSYGEIDILKPF